MVLRTVQTGNGEAYARTTSARRPDGSWREMWTMRFSRVGPATEPRSSVHPPNNPGSLNPEQESHI
jgi:hypothetical protein